MDGDILETWGGRGIVHRLEEHGPAVLVEKLRRGVDVVVCSCIGSPDYHHGVPCCCRGGGVVDAVVVHRGLEEVGVGFEPG